MKDQSRKTNWAQDKILAQWQRRWISK